MHYYLHIFSDVQKIHIKNCNYIILKDHLLQSSVDPQIVLLKITVYEYEIQELNDLSSSTRYILCSFS